MTDEIRQHTSSTFAVTVDGTPLPAEVEEVCWRISSVMAGLRSGRRDVQDRAVPHA